MSCNKFIKSQREDILLQELYCTTLKCWTKSVLLDTGHTPPFVSTLYDSLHFPLFSSIKAAES